MILQRTEAGLLLFRQTEHARLAGSFAEAWGNERFPQPVRRDSALVAAHRHDDGWAEWELAPSLNEAGEPVDFLRIPVREHVELYRRGVDLVEAEDAFAGLVSSLHGKRLYTRPLEPGGEPRYKRLKPDDLKLAERYVDGEVERERRLVASLGGPVRQDAEEVWALLQAWDRLSLFVCLAALGSGAGFSLPAVRTASGDEVRIAASTPSPGIVVLAPYPFGPDGAPFEIEGCAVAGDRWPDASAYRASLRRAGRVVVRFACEPG